MSVSLDGKKLNYILTYRQSYSHPGFPGGGAKIYDMVAVWTITTGKKLVNSTFDQQLVHEYFTTRDPENPPYGYSEAGEALEFGFYGPQKEPMRLKAQLIGARKDLGNGTHLVLSNGDSDDFLELNGQSMDPKAFKIVHGCHVLEPSGIAEVESQL